MEQQTRALLSFTLAPSTVRSYKSCFNRYTSFCNYYRLRSLPTNENNLMTFATHLAGNSSYSNIKLHLAAIRHFDILSGNSNFDSPKPRLFMLLRAIKRKQGNAHRKPSRIPITPSLLIKIHTYLLHSNISPLNRRMLWAAATTAFFGFLRSSEFVSPTTKSFDPQVTLLFSDASIRHSRCLLQIKGSKTDPFRFGCTIRLSPTSNLLCPVNALYNYLTLHPTRRGPLFTYEDGTFLTQRRLNTFVKAALPSPPDRPVSSHSFRIGAATTAASANVPSWLIQQLGRWNSNCHQIYIRIPDQTIDNTCSLLSTTLATNGVWNPDLMLQ